MTEPLTITTAQRDDHQLDLTIQFGPERTEEALQRAAKLVSKQARIPGFRPGKAPFATVVRLFGRDALLGQIIDELGEEALREALENQSIEPYGQAQLDDVEMDPLTFRVVIPLRPEVTLGDYKSIRVEAPDGTVDESDVEEQLDDARSRRATWEEVERPAALGDSVVLDIKGTVGDETIMDNQDWDLVLKGGESGWLPGFDDAFAGMVAGDEKTFTLRYPEDSASRFKGQEATFRAVLKTVKGRVRPELDDDFARSLGEFEDLADLRAKLLAHLQEERKAEAEEELNEKAVEALVAVTTITYPPSAIEEMIDQLMRETEMSASRAGFTLADYLRLQSTTPEAFREQLRPAAEQRLKGRLAIGELAKQEAIAVTPEEIQAEVERLLEGAPNERVAESVRNTFTSPEGQSFIERDLRTRKALARLREIATGAEPAGESAAATEAAPDANAEPGAQAAPAAEVDATAEAEAASEPAPDAGPES